MNAQRFGSRLTTRSLLALVLLAASGLSPEAYAKGPRVTSRNSVCKQGRVAASPFVRTELFFGARKPDGTEVSATEWEDFLDKVITPEFPDGLTVLVGKGQFRGSDGIVIEERSVLLVLLYPLRARKESGTKIEKIRAAYKRDFRQESVLRVDDAAPVCVSF